MKIRIQFVTLVATNKKNDSTIWSMVFKINIVFKKVVRDSLELCKFRSRRNFIKDLVTLSKIPITDSIAKY